MTHAEAQRQYQCALEFERVVYDRGQADEIMEAAAERESAYELMRLTYLEEQFRGS